MCQRHVAPCLELDAAAAARHPVGVFRAHHAEPVLRPLQISAGGQARRRGAPAGAGRAGECIPASGRVENALEQKELAATIDRFLRTLPEKDCNLFLRRYWYVDSISVIADRYGMKENTVKSILFRTREKLRKFLGEEGIAV